MHLLNVNGRDCAVAVRAKKKPRERKAHAAHNGLTMNREQSRRRRSARTVKGRWVCASALFRHASTSRYPAVRRAGESVCESVDVLRLEEKASPNG